MATSLRKVVFPVAGLGTRFLPATKAVAKEMLPIVDKPLIQYAVEEAQAAGLTEIIFVTGRGKTEIVDHFDHAYELEDTLRAKGKDDAYRSLVSDMPKAGQVMTTRQQRPLGLGHAIWCARHIIGNEPFAVSLPDVLTDPARSALKDLVEVYEQTGGNVITLKEVARDEVKKYGIADVGGSQSERPQVRGLVEKPDPEKSPSRLHVLGRYILQPAVFDEIERGERGAGGEIQLTDAMARLIGKQPFHGSVYTGEFWDCGDKLGFLKANISLALRRPELSSGLKAFLKDLSQ
ncbi:MAG: UTP--glucose-1-phosphate uridylyltransferase [Alphaproteobacteria bacterium]